jgi:hypothetical protein
MRAATRCDDTNLGVLDELLRPWGDRTQKEARVRQRGVAAPPARAGARAAGPRHHPRADDTDERYGADYRRYEHERVPVDAVRELVEHLRCEGLLPERFTDGVFDGHLVDALIVFQRRHMVTNAGFVDTPTREAFLQDSREADFATLLRVLRERVVDATGLIEDGSAAHAWGTVMGHKLDTAEFQMDAGHDAAPNAAPDLISPATEAAAQALGWTDAEAATRALGQLLTHGHAQVAVRLPPLPEYHGGEMALRAEIHRGDVYYDYPYTNTGAQIHQPTAQRPVFTLYVTHEGQEIALARWATTIGGWKTERTPGGGVGMSYKESPVGQRIMRDIIASPAWLPPPSTPNEDMVRRVPGVGYRANNALFGPSYRSAYGMVMLMHHRVMPTRAEGDPPRIHDEGIRTHGSVSYRSIVRGTSHGCHRLYNHLAVRLASFVLASPAPTSGTGPSACGTPSASTTWAPTSTSGSTRAATATSSRLRCGWTCWKGPSAGPAVPRWRGSGAWRAARLRRRWRTRRTDRAVGFTPRENDASVVQLGVGENPQTKCS